MLKSDGALLFHAPELFELLPDHTDLLMRDVPGGIWLPKSDAARQSGAKAVFAGTKGNRAVVMFFSTGLAAKVATKMYYCDKNPNHYYDSSEVKKLKKIPGGWRCGQGDNGTVS